MKNVENPELRRRDDFSDVLGIDPGLGATGYGLVRVIGAHCDAPALVDCGVLKTNAKKEMPDRLREIYDLVMGLIQKHSPRTLAVEKAFYGKSVSVALTIGQARGAAILAAANLGLPVFEISAREVKQAVTGNGAADKTQVQYMVGQLLNLKNPPDSPDACDALAVALAYHFRSKISVGATGSGLSSLSLRRRGTEGEVAGAGSGRADKPALVKGL
jgi:crossover junction endodeoxyribonuclease RuvC